MAVVSCFEHSTRTEIILAVIEYVIPSWRGTAIASQNDGTAVDLNRDGIGHFVNLDFVAISLCPVLGRVSMFDKGPEKNKMYFLWSIWVKGIIP
jgi:hypothetical protein